MTNNEIDKLLSMLDGKTLNEVKEFLLKQKNKNINNLRQRTFENYMCNKWKKFNWYDLNGTLIFEDNNNITFSNGISFYILNKGLVNITSPKIINNMTNYAIQSQHRIRKMDEDLKDKLLNKAESFKTDLVEVQYGECVDKEITKLTSFINYSKVIEFDFKTLELRTAEILLDNLKFKIDIENPLLYGENDNGKVYILGHKYNN